MRGRSLKHGVRAAGAALLAAALQCGTADAQEARSASATDARVEVSLAAREVTLYRGGERIASFPVGIGQPEWPVQTGEWEVYQIDFNPDWNPPEDESWSRDRDYKAPGEAGNPMGRVRIRYDPPRSIHGTDDEDSIGRAESHGSVRIRNDDGIALAQMLMELAGDGRPDEWIDRVLAQPHEMVTVELSHPIPIHVRDG